MTIAHELHSKTGTIVGLHTLVEPLVIVDFIKCIYHPIRQGVSEFT